MFKEIPLPPFSYEGSAVSILYSVPSSVFEGKLPRFFEPYTFKKRAFFEVMFIKYSKAISLTKPDEDFSYLEVGYNTYVKFKKDKGNYYFKMYLSDEVELGKVNYRCVKYQADIKINYKKNYSYASVKTNGAEVIRATVKKRHDLFSYILTPIIRLYLRLSLSHIATYTYSRECSIVTKAGFPIDLDEKEVSNFFLPSERDFITKAPWHIDSYKVNIGELDDIFLIEPISWGILNSKEVTSPKLVLLWNPIIFKVNRPEIFVV